MDQQSLHSMTPNENDSGTVTVIGGTAVCVSVGSY